jgi:hypothetical protein
MEPIKQALEPFIDLLPVEARDYWWAIFGAAALVVLIVLSGVLGRIVRRLFGRTQAPPDWDAQGQESLADYPPPPGPPGKRRLTVEGVPVRLRLVVIAPLGRRASIDSSAVEGTLNQVVYRLGAICREDEPQVRIWPQQLSQKGFAATFHRYVQKPEADGTPSRWILVAGHTPARPRPWLLGVALYADEPVTIGRLTLEPNRWAEVLRVQVVEE